MAWFSKKTLLAFLTTLKKHKNQILKRNRLQFVQYYGLETSAVVLVKSFACLLASIRFASSDAQHCEIVQSSLAHSASQNVLDEFQKLNANQVSCVIIQRSSPTKS